MTRLNRRIPAATAVLAVLVLLCFQPQIDSDTAVYWSWFSIFYDGDLNPGNQYFPVLGSWARVYLSHPTDTGYFPIVFPLGPALSWLPGLILGEVAAAGVDAMTHGAIPAIHDGFDWIARSGGLLMSAVWILAGIALLRSWLRQWFSPRITEHALLAIIFGTPLVFYGCFNPGFSHALEFFVLSWFCAVFARKKPLQLTPVQTVLAGMAAVAILYTRLQDAGWSVVPWLMIITDMHHRGIRRCMPYCRATAQFGIGALIAFIPQFYLWFTVHHSILPPYPASYFLYIPIHAFRVLFSLKRGVFTWSPVLLIALPGLFLAPRSLRRRLGAAAIGVLYVTFMSASVSDWWGGGCFGARRFVGSLPLFAAALAAMFHHVSHRVRPATRTSARIIMGLTCLAVIWNLVLMIIYIEHAAEADTLIETMIRQPVAMLTSIDPLHMISNGWFGQLAQMSRLDPVSESAGAALILAVLATIMLMGASMLRPDVRRLAPVRWSKRVFVVLTGGICLVIAGCAWMHGSAGIATAVDLTGGVGWAHRSASGAFYTGNGTEIRLPMRGHPMRSEDGIIRLDPLMVRSRMVIPLNVPVEAAGITVVVDRTDLHSLWHKGQALQVIVEAIEADGAQSREFFIIGTPFFGRTVRSSIPDARLIQDGVVDTGTFAQVISWQFNAPRRLDRIVFIGPDDDSTSVQILGLAFDSHQLLGTNRDCPAGEIPASVQVAPVVQLRRHTDCSVSVNLDIQNPGADRVMDLYIALSLESDRPLFYRFSSQLIRGQDNRTGIPVILEADSQYSGELLHDFVHVAPETTPADVLFAVYMTARGEPGTFLGRPGIARVRMEPVVFLDAVGKPLIAIKRESDDVSDGVLSEKQHD